ncbi:MAG: hypothetical protein JXX14_07340 [Deltaproteobacteria bacterium]|nr:hypothetical protein [Deltaproteobacteria bacterium]
MTAGIFMCNALLCVAVMMQGACAPDDDDRCGDGYVYNKSTQTCEIAAELMDTSSDSNSADTDDSSADTGGTVQGDYCILAGSVCSGDAPYCAGRAITDTDGYCAKIDCTIGGEDCPEGTTCCDFVFTGAVFCMENDGYAAVQGYCGG